MAITAAASSSNNSSTLPTISISFHPIISCSQPFNTHTTFSSVSLSMNATKLLPSPPPPAAAAAAEAIEVAAVFEAVIFSDEFERLLSSEESEDDGGERDWRNGMLIRRKRRRKRRKAEEKFENEKAIKNVSLKLRNDGHILTKKAEAHYSFCLKEEARVEALRKKIEEKSGRKLTLAQWAKAAGMSRFNLDMVLCNGREAEERIISCYRKLVVSIAYAYQGKGLSLEDLIQEGNLGLLHGATKFNPEKGCKLSTYVYWWIRQGISRAITKSKIIRLPGSINKLVPRICEANAVFSRKMHRWPTREELAEALNKDPATVGLALGSNRDPISIDHTFANAGYMSLQEIIAGPKETTPEEIVKKHFKKRDLERLLNGQCDSREVNILKLYYGFNGDAPLSFEEIGRRFRLSRERVRQISCNAMCKLKQANNVGDFKAYIE